MSVGDNIKYIRLLKGLTQEELANLMNYKSRSTINKIELGLADISSSKVKKFAEVLNVSTSYLMGWTDDFSPPKEKPKHRIPVLGSIPAGIPIEAVEDILDYEEISEEMANSGEFFALKVKGDSMLPTIKNGDIVIIKKQEDADSGKICVVMINGFDATLKEIKKDTNGLWILPHNPSSDFKPTFFTNTDLQKVPVKILGIAVEIRRTL